MKNKRQVARVVAMLALAGLNGAAQTVTFSDHDFNDSDWTAEIIFNEAGNSAKFEARKDPNRGNPGAFRRIKHEGETRSTRVEIHVAHLRGGGCLRPAGKRTHQQHWLQLRPEKPRITYSLGLHVLSADLPKQYVLPFSERSHFETRLDSVRPKRSRSAKLYPSRRGWTEASEFLG